MENNELLLQLIKKLESGELEILVGERADHINIHLDDNDQGNSIKLAVIKKGINISSTILLESHYEASWNDEFKKKFYKEKNLARNTTA